MTKDEARSSQSDLPTKPTKITDWSDYQKGSIVSRKIIQKQTGNVTFFAFDKGEALSEHVSPYDALVCVVDGEAEVIVSGNPFRVKAGEMILMPANLPHALKAMNQFKMLLIMVRS